MSNQQVEVLVVGAGQAGVAMSEHLSDGGVPHLVLERSRIAERWRTERWDSLVANGPAWHDRFPGLEFGDVDPDGFAAQGRRWPTTSSVRREDRRPRPTAASSVISVRRTRVGPASASRPPKASSTPASSSPRPAPSSDR